MSLHKTAPLRVLVAGEALVDFVPCSERETFAYRPLPGGSPFNVAVGLARLEVPAGFLGTLSNDPFGSLLRSHLEKNGVDRRFVRSSSGPSTLAFVVHEPGQEPEYAFYAQGAADRQLKPKDLPAHIPESVKALHFGSFSIAVEPIGSTLIEWAEQEHKHRTISLDPNVRPAVVGEMASYLERLERWLRVAHLIKVSQADLALVYPAETPAEVANDWLRNGANLVVVTRGSNGVTGFMRNLRIDLPSIAVSVVDTVGAGDAFMSGLLAFLDRDGRLQKDALPQLPEESLRQGLGFAQRVAAITCTRAGANPPRLSELP